MPRRSAGILLYRLTPGGACEVLVGHMGGPFWAKKDAGGWSIPKGEYTGNEIPLEVAPHREGGDDLAARLLQRRKVDTRTVGRRLAQFLLELAEGDGEGVLPLPVLPLRDGPAAGVLLRPEGAAHVPDQHLRAVVASPLEQDARTRPHGRIPPFFLQ